MMTPRPGENLLYAEPQRSVGVRSMSQTETSIGTTPADVEPPRRSPYSLGARVGRVLWGLVATTLFRLSPRPLWGWRRWLLRAFGAKIGRGVCIDPSVSVEIPWNLTIGDHCRVCERAILYCLGPVRLGEGTLVGPFAHICAGTHDYTSPKFTLLRQPIEIGARCVLRTASFVAPGVVVAGGTVLEPRAALFADSEPGATYAGSPARKTA